MSQLVFIIIIIIIGGVKPYNIIRVYVYTSEGFIPITRTRHLYVLRLVHKRYT